MFSIVVATDLNRGFGNKGQLPWPKLIKDMTHFSKLTGPSFINNNRLPVVIMGFKTWLSIPLEKRPLKNRLNIVIDTKTLDDNKNTNIKHQLQFVSSFQEALDYCSPDKIIYDHDFVFVIGGQSLYEEAIVHEGCQFIYLTKIFKKFDHDRVFPQYADSFELDTGFERQTYKQDGITYQILRLNRIDERHDEYQYLDLCQEILDFGVCRGDRTGTGTLSLFGKQTRWNLREQFPLLTTKRVFWRGLAEELLWFVKGETDAKLLQEKNINIWNDNTTREFLDSRGLVHYKEGDIGPGYGFQWRHFGADYEGCNKNYDGKGVDQLLNVIETIKKNPNDRRMCMSAWNPAALDKMALPPCHMFAQFYVADGELSCHMYQRSCDMGLGVPFNIASYALLVYMVAHLCDLKPGDFIHSMGDAHVYLNHIEALQEQLERTPTKFPKLKIKRKVDKIEDYQFDDFELIDYNPLKTIKMKMAV